VQAAVASASRIRVAPREANSIARASTGGTIAPSTVPVANSSRRPQRKSTAGATARRSGISRSAATRTRLRPGAASAAARQRHESPHEARMPVGQRQRHRAAHRVADEPERRLDAGALQAAGDLVGDRAEVEAGAGGRRVAETRHVERDRLARAGQ
jgi:hypothetical protein